MKSEIAEEEQVEAEEGGISLFHFHFNQRPAEQSTNQPTIQSASQRIESKIPRMKLKVAD